MTSLRVGDLKTLDASTLLLHNDGDPQTLGERLQAAIATLIPADVTAIECFDDSLAWTRRILADPEQRIEHHFQVFLEQQLTHPLFPLFATGKLRQPACISDVMSLRELRNLAIYADFLAPLGIDRQLGVMLTLGAGASGVLVLGRKGKDFSETEKLRLQALVPHIECATRTADRIKSGPGNGIMTRHQNPLTIIAHSSLLADLRISKREAEILSWLAHGKSDTQIAAICAIGERTVQKHCENIYRKLGVENRTAAVMQALERHG